LQTFQTLATKPDATVTHVKNAEGLIAERDKCQLVEGDIVAMIPTTVSMAGLGIDIAKLRPKKITVYGVTPTLPEISIERHN
jgi:hypothetical protein